MSSIAALLADPKKLDDVLTEIDDELRKSGVAIPGRSIGAFSLIARRLNSKIAMPSREATAINDWFIRRYGERLKMEFQLGVTVVRVLGDPYRVRLPVSYGSENVNPLECIEDVSPSLWRRLSDTEIDKIANEVVRSFDYFQNMGPLPREATVDLDTAADHIVRSRPEPGLSKFASLQGVEKSLKAYIHARGGNPPKGGKDAHNLTALAGQAEGLGLAPVSRQLIAKVQCSPGVRYDIKVTPDEAVDALLAAVELCAHVGQGYP